jgi:hypothetical protein
MNFQSINRAFRSPIESGAEHVEKQPEALELELEIEGRKVKINLSTEVKDWLKEKGIVTEDDIREFFRDLLTNNPESRFKDIIYEFKFRERFFVEITEKDGDLLVNIEQNSFEVRQIISEGITRRDFLKVLAGLGLGLGLASGIYWFLRSLGFGKGTEAPTPTSTPTSTLTPTSTSTPTSTPQPTTTPTSTPEPTPTITINREEVERLKSRYREILTKEYPTLWGLLNLPSTPIIVNYSEVVRKYFIKRNWLRSNIVNGDRSFLFAVQPGENGTIKITFPKAPPRGFYQSKTILDRLEIEAFEGIKDRAPVDDVLWELDKTPFNELQIIISVKTASLDEEIKMERIDSKLVLEATPGEGKICEWCVVEIAGWNIPKPGILTDEEKEKYFLASAFLVILMERLISKTSKTFQAPENVKKFLNNYYKLHSPHNIILSSENSFQALLELILEIMEKWEK